MRIKKAIIKILGLYFCLQSSHSLSREPISQYEAQRFLSQSTFGATAKDIQLVRKKGYEGWIQQQFSIAKRLERSKSYMGHLALTQHLAQQAEPTYEGYRAPIFNQTDAKNDVLHYQMAAWWEHSLGGHPKRRQHGSDQLRQRTAYALSQLMVVSSGEALLRRRAEGLAHYYDLLVEHSFGNFRDLLYDISTSPAMGVYLSHRNNRKANPKTGIRPDENYARELMQLFTIGLYELNIDGSLNSDGDPKTVNDNASRPIAAYDQGDVEELAKIMTGWTLADQRFGKSGAKRGNYTRPMQFFSQFHENERAEKGDGKVVVLGNSINLRRGSGEDHLNEVLDVLFQHPNVGPFVSKHLIQRLVTSNPSAEYIKRVATVFNNNGKGIRGDMKATVSAILLDPEARNPAINEQFGQVKEPLLAYTQFLRAFNSHPEIKYQQALGYWFSQPERYLGQAALRSPTVFNFFSPEFVPNDTAFKADMRSAPEMEIQQNAELINFNNLIFQTLFDNDKAKIERRQKERNKKRKKDRPPEHAIFINLDGFTHRLKQRLGNNFSGLNATPITAKSRSAVNQLIDEMSMRLGVQLDATQHQKLSHFLLTSAATKQGSTENHGHRIASHCAYFLATAPQFRIQR